MFRRTCAQFFALERTYLSWMHMAVTLGGVTSALVGYSYSEVRPDASAVQQRTIVCGSTATAPLSSSSNPTLGKSLSICCVLHTSTNAPATLDDKHWLRVASNICARTARNFRDASTCVYCTTPGSP